MTTFKCRVLVSAAEVWLSNKRGGGSEGSAACIRAGRDIGRRGWTAAYVRPIAQETVGYSEMTTTGTITNVDDYQRSVALRKMD